MHARTVMDTPSRTCERTFRLLALGAGLLVLMWLGHALADSPREWVQLALGGMSATGLVAVLTAYTLMMALPFVPGIELGVMLMLMLGVDGIVLVYLCTQIALALSFCAGRWLPPELLATTLDGLRMKRAAGHVRAMARVPDSERLAWAGARLHGAGGRLLRHPHLTLALLVNLPGNGLIGGAGGIGLLAGSTRLISCKAFVAVMALATLPVPVFLWIRGG